MQKEYLKFKELIDNEMTRKNELIDSVESDKKEVEQLRNKYQLAIANDDDKSADETQLEIESLERSIKRNQDKVKLIDDGVISKELELQADKVLNESNKAIDRLSSEAEQIVKEYNELKQQLMNKASELKPYRSSGSKYIKAVEVVANKFPTWAENKNNVRYDISVNRYRYKKQNRVPILKGLEQRELHHLTGGY